MKFLKQIRENIDTRLFINIINKQTDVDSLELMSTLLEAKKTKIQKEDERVVIKGYKRYDDEIKDDEIKE